jgi:hypothetical protein
VERVLKKADGKQSRPSLLVISADASYQGVDSYDISLEKQEVIVKGSIEYEKVLEIIKKTGKEVRIPSQQRAHLLTDFCVTRCGPGKCSCKEYGG